MYSLLLVLSVILCMAFLTTPFSAIELVGTKWISPINDTSSVSLCFTSERHVFYNDGTDDWQFEIGYTIEGDLIKINVLDSIGNQMTLKEDNGILRQVSNQSKNFPENFIIVPNSKCE